MEKMLTARETSSQGELMRMLECHLDTPLAWTDAEQALSDFLNQNYGVAGRKYAQWLVDNQETAREVTAECITRIRKKLRSPDAERFWTAGIGACVAGLTLCGPKYANIFSFDVPKIFERAYAQWVFKARTLISANLQCAEDVLNAYTREFHGQFVRLERGKGPVAMFQDNRNVTNTSTRGKVAGRVEYDMRPGWIDYYIELATFKRYCATRNYGFSAIKTELEKTMVVELKRKDLLSKTGGPEMFVNCLKISKQIAPDAQDD